MVDQHLKEIKPPSMVHCNPMLHRNISSFLKLQSFSLFCYYYFLPVLFGILSPELWNYFALFSLTIHTLVQPSISENHLQCYQKMLNKFRYCLKDIYGERYMFSNCPTYICFCIYLLPLENKVHFGYTLVFILKD